MSAIILPPDDINFTEILLRCDCHDLTHLASVGYFTDDKPPRTIFVEVAYDHYTPFWRRVWITLKYIIGRRCRSQGEIVLDLKDAKELRAFLDEFITKEEQPNEQPIS